MHQLSYWEKEAYIHHDIVVIGAGIVGTIAAIEAKKQYPNRSIALIERATLPFGASTKNAGFACFGSISEMMDDLSRSSEASLIDLISMRWEGLSLLQTYLPSLQTVDLDFFGGYEVFKKHESAGFKQQAKEIPYFNELVKKATRLEDCFSVVQNTFGLNVHPELIQNQYEGQLNPAKLMKHLLTIATQLGVNTFFGLKLKSWEDSETVTLDFDNDQRMFCDQLILATNAFTNDLVDNLDLKPYRNQVLITSKLQNLKLKGTFHYNKGYTYFRNVGQRVLLGGFRDVDLVNEQTTEFGLSDNIQDVQEKFLRDIINVSGFIDHRWSGILASGDSKKALIHKVSDHVFLGVRLGGMGVAIGAQVAKDTIALID